MSTKNVCAQIMRMDQGADALTPKNDLHFVCVCGGGGGGLLFFGADVSTPDPCSQLANVFCAHEILSLSCYLASRRK